MCLSLLINTHDLNIAEKFKNLLGDDEIKSALQTLDQLTGEEYGMVHAQVYRSVTKGVHGLPV